MQLLIVRHAVAEERDEFAQTGQDDSQRPLTKDGRRKMERGVRGLRAVVRRIDVLATSPYTRAAQTAKIVADAYDALDPVTVSELTPEGKYKDFIGWLRGQAAHDLVAIVGHEPHLSGLVSLLLTGRNDPVLVLKKGAACLIEFASDEPHSDSDARADIGAGKAKLLWSLTPGQLRRLRN
jgi:phosphohistidine phosphatase